MGMDWKAKQEIVWMGKRARKHFARYIKRYKAKLERRRAKNDPDCSPGYNRYHGYAD